MSTAQNPSHIYSKAGTYWVKLTVANVIGADTDSILVAEVREASIPVNAALQEPISFTGFLVMEGSLTDRIRSMFSEVRATTMCG